MHAFTKLPAWEQMLKRIVWQQLGEINGKRILDFGSGEGITAAHYSENNSVIAIEPSEEMLSKAWRNDKYVQIAGDVSALAEFESDSFDLIICHNVLEYIDDKKTAITEMSRLLKTGGTLSIVKHNRFGRVMQMAVLLNDINRANDLLDGKNSTASKFGCIRYYEDDDILKWCNQLKLKPANKKSRLN
ncbi:MAG TPA: class I SAM-dependent methyltransferase [Candidatus Copromonas faecavium]|uniref:Class I SAM-dependent methyltransferase n=1 Tax=Candidatus Copromonas faecavium (nom. illeg.) TaxID=2840740 RepID=A0A9D1D4V1_9FIRM|nr:class I SAM-dependent methyltransferase [Candidatus Copromonas faecavium]